MRNLEYVVNLMRFAFRANPLLYLSMVVSMLSVAIELLAMSSLFPLFQLVSGSVPSTDGIIAQLISMMGVAVSAQALLWAFLALFAIRIITQLVGQSLSLYLGKRVMAQLCSGAFERIIHSSSIREINEKSIGFYISLAGDESFRASTLVISLTQFISTAALALLYFAAIAKYSLVVAGLILLFSLGSLIMLYRVTKLSHRLGGQQTEESRRAGTLFLDSLNNIKAVRSFSAENYVVKIHRAMMFSYTKTLFWIEELSLSTRLVPILLLLLLFGMWLAWSAQALANVGLAFVVTMIVYLMRFFPTVGQGVALLMRIVSDAKSGKDVTAILGSPQIDQSGFAHLVDDIHQIGLQEVGFSYAQGGKKKVLKGVSLKFEQGRSYALVGKSGVGKSTLIDLMLKFYLPTAGRICMNDEPISGVPDCEIRKKVILVSQEAAIFDDTVINNVRLGMDASIDEVHAACKGAEIHEVIEGMADGYDTRLQYQGKNLSGGQRQRIAIARALLRKPDVLIFDESTSALDKATQEQVVGNILREYAGKIVIFVTHDPHVMERVDEVIDLGKINAAYQPHTADPH